MTLANLREAHHCRTVEAECLACRHEAIVSVDSLPNEVPVPDVALSLKCGACGSKRIVTRPNMLEVYRSTPGVGRSGAR